MQKHKIAALLIAIPTAFILWIYVVTTVTPETTQTIYNIPVTVEGSIALEERGLMVTSDTGNTVNLELSGSRVSLSKLDAGNVRVAVDVSKITEAGDYTMSYNVYYPDTVTASEINILQRTPEKVSITVSSVETKSVPVRFDWDGKVQDGYLFDAENVTMDVTEITLTGPDYEVAPVEAAVVRFDVSKLTDTTVEICEYELQDAQGNRLEVSDLTKVSAESVSVTLPILRYKDLTLRVTLKPGGGATAENATVTLDPDKIRVTGSEAVLEELDDEFVVGVIDLAEIASGDAKIFPLTLPAGVNNTSGVEQVVATVRLTGLESKEITVTSVEVINVPSGYEAEVTTKNITVILRGAKKDLTALTEENVHITVDLSSYKQSGAFTVPATVTIDDIPNVGVVGSINVGVSLQ